MRAVRRIRQEKMRPALVIEALLICRKSLCLAPRRNNKIIATGAQREVAMMDVLMIGIGLGFFALAITYAHAIDR
jgi:hypothetical protein